jgi:hypothetical protein
MTQEIYYIFPDFIDEINSTSTQNEFNSLIAQGKGTIYYNVESFVDAFNDEKISDLGIIKAFDDTIYKNHKMQQRIKRELEDLVHQRFNIETLENKLSQIFNEEIKVEYGCEDVDYLADWNLMFSSEQDVIGGDFDIYILKHKNIDNGGNEFYVTEIGYDFFKSAE